MTKPPRDLLDNIERTFGDIESAGREAMFGASYWGVCYACGEIDQHSIEPDARNYPCPYCEENALFGLEEAILDACAMVPATRAPRADACPSRDGAPGDPHVYENDLCVFCGQRKE